MKNKSDFKIFIIDNDIFCQNMHHQHLFVLGYVDVTAFEDGSSCLMKLSHQPDIVFLNDGTDITEALELIKKIKRYNPDIYVVLLLHKENEHSIADASKSGAFASILKTENQLESIKSVLRNIHQVSDLLKKKY